MNSILKSMKETECPKCDCDEVISDGNGDLVVSMSSAMSVTNSTAADVAKQ